MLCNLLSEIGVSEEQFAEACEKANANPVHKKLVSEILAVDNFSAFKKLMQRRNKEMNQLAMRSLSDPNGEVPSSQAMTEEEMIKQAI